MYKLLLLVFGFVLISSFVQAQSVTVDRADGGIDVYTRISEPLPSCVLDHIPLMGIEPISVYQLTYTNRLLVSTPDMEIWANGVVEDGEVIVCQ